jgi:hypothetical protein
MFLRITIGTGTETALLTESGARTVLVVTEADTVRLPTVTLPLCIVDWVRGSGAGRGDHRPSFQRDRRGDDGGRRGGGRGRVPFVAGPPRSDREAAAAQAVAEAAAKKVDYTSLILDYSDI